MKLRACILQDGRVVYVIETDADETFALLKGYIRENFKLDDQAERDLIDTDTVDNFVWFFNEYVPNYDIEFEVIPTYSVIEIDFETWLSYYVERYSK